MRTAEEIAEAVIAREYGSDGTATGEEIMQTVLDVADDQTAHDLFDTVVCAAREAIAELETWQVIATQAATHGESIIGAYSSSFEARAVADAWNRVNGQYGITYRVEEDA